MKRILSLLLALIMVSALAGCGILDKIKSSSESGENVVNSTTEIENKVGLSIDKSKYERNERIEVTLDFGKLKQEDAIIVIVTSDTEHNKAISYETECAWEEYRWLDDFSEVPFYMWAPKDKDGLFDVRVYADSESGKELASETFAVGNATLPKETTNTPPKDGSSMKKAFFNPPQAIYMDVKVGGSTATEGTYSFALLAGNYSYTLNNDGVFLHTSADTKTHYCPYGDGWIIDNSDGYGYGQVPEEDLIYEMTEYLDTFYADAETGGYYNNISKYYVGTETICYRNC